METIQEAIKAAIEPAPLIYAAMAAAIKDIDPVNKSGKNKFQDYKYRTIDTVYGAVNDAIAKNGVCLTVDDEILSREEVIVGYDKKMSLRPVLRCTYTFWAADGSFMKNVCVGEAIDNSDKGIAQAQASAFKYMAFRVFCIPVGDPTIDIENKHEEVQENYASAPKATNSAQIAAATQPQINLIKQKIEYMQKYLHALPEESQKKATMFIENIQLSIEKGLSKTTAAEKIKTLDEQCGKLQMLIEGQANKEKEGSNG